MLWVLGKDLRKDLKGFFDVVIFVDRFGTSPENQWLENVFSTEIVPFSRDMLVFGDAIQMNFIGWPLDSF